MQFQIFQERQLGYSINTCEFIAGNWKSWGVSGTSNVTYTGQRRPFIGSTNGTNLVSGNQKRFQVNRITYWSKLSNSSFVNSLSTEGTEDRRLSCKSNCSSVGRRFIFFGSMVRRQEDKFKWVRDKNLAYKKKNKKTPGILWMHVGDEWGNIAARRIV